MSKIQPKTQRSIIAHKSTCAPSGSIPRTGYTKKHSSISWSVSGDTRGNLPRAKKQSTGLFVSRCGESGLFESRHSVKNKKLFHQTVKELFVVGVTGFEPTASWSRTKRATNCATPRKKIRSNFAAAVVGDERIELPQTESESVALPLCKSPLHVC